MKKSVGKTGAFFNRTKVRASEYKRSYSTFSNFHCTNWYLISSTECYSLKTQKSERKLTHISDISYVKQNASNIPTNSKTISMVRTLELL